LAGERWEKNRGFVWEKAWQDMFVPGEEAQKPYFRLMGFFGSWLSKFLYPGYHTCCRNPTRLFHHPSGVPFLSFSLSNWKLGIAYIRK
jgi:hypothetical protein